MLNGRSSSSSEFPSFNRLDVGLALLEVVVGVLFVKPASNVGIVLGFFFRAGKETLSIVAEMKRSPSSF